MFLTWYKHHVTNTEKTQCFLSEEFETERRNTNVNEERNTAKTTGEDAWRDEVSGMQPVLGFHMYREICHSTERDNIPRPELLSGRTVFLTPPCWLRGCQHFILQDFLRSLA